MEERMELLKFMRKMQTLAVHKRAKETKQVIEKLEASKLEQKKK